MSSSSRTREHSPSAGCNWAATSTATTTTRRRRSCSTAGASGSTADRVVPLDVGGRVTGRVGRYTLGLLSTQTGAEDETLALPARSTNFSVVRLRRDILRRSSIGLIAAGRSVAQGGPGRNLGYGVDGTFAFFSSLNINTYWARTETAGLTGDDTSHRAELNYNGDRYGCSSSGWRWATTSIPSSGSSAATTWSAATCSCGSARARAGGRRSGVSATRRTSPTSRTVPACSNPASARASSSSSFRAATSSRSPTTTSTSGCWRRSRSSA